MNPITPRRHVGLAVAASLAAILVVAPARAASPGPGRAFLQVDVPRRTAYVGESIPVTVHAYFRVDTGATLNRAPALSSSDFTLAQGASEQSRASVNGALYRVVSWKDHLSPVKAGRYALGLDLPTTIEWQDVVAPTPEAADPFGDDDLGSMFGAGGDPFAQMQKRMQTMMDRFARESVGAVRHSDLVLRSPRVPLEVLALPAASRPDGFGGAVGHFAFSATATPLDAHAGEPITLTMRVAGDGNLDRVDVAGLPSSSDWKTYPPTATAGVGEKTFTQPVVPLRAGLDAIPAVTFASFDPEAKKYVTETTAPIPVTVRPATGVLPTSSGAVPAPTDGPRLAPNADTEGRLVATLEPVVSRPWFWALQAVFLASVGAAFAAAAVHRRRKADVDRPLREEARRVVRDGLGAMDTALAAGDTTAFFGAARRAIQAQLGALWHLPASAISMVEIASRLPATEADHLRPVFDADEARFGGGAAIGEDLATWRQRVERDLQRLGKLEAA
jgi:hypothetical protein